MNILGLNYANLNMSFCGRPSYKKQFEEMQRQGKSKEEICDALSLTPKQYHCALERSRNHSGVKYRQDTTNITKEQIEELIISGKSRREVL